MAKNIVKQSVAYSYIISQPFATYIDAYPMLQSQWLAEQELQHMSYGDHSQVVRVIQHKLNDLKYYDESIDGEYGLFTEYALKKFQADHALIPDGSINQETVEAIIQAEQNYYLEKLSSIDYPLYYGTSSDEIKALQRALFYLGYYDDQFDGIFGPITETALLNAQRAFGLEETPAVTIELVETIQQETHITTQIKEDISNNIAQDNTNESVKKNTGNNQIEHVIQNAKDQTGVRYQWGGTSPSGFDCSGFVQYVFNQQSISVPRTVSEMWNQTKSVDQPSVGDLVFFETYKQGPSHVGIYLGNGQFIHASESKGVMTSALSQDYWQTRYLGSKRVQIK
ncbi:MAG: hypothetical protein GX972_02250 [Amphibacillus sp.]|nr:hypothetical protein [Amphibacillus sp.]